jgi:uncharacterized protein (DUF1810 family)
VRWRSGLPSPRATRPSSISGHGVLGPRLKECTTLVNAIEGRTILEILGSPDDMKFHSSMTLFGEVSSDPDFAAAITKYYGRKKDQGTLDLLSHGGA